MSMPLSPLVVFAVGLSDAVMLVGIIIKSMVTKRVLIGGACQPKTEQIVAATIVLKVLQR